MQVKFPTMGEMVAFIKKATPKINDYNSETGLLKVEDTAIIVKSWALTEEK